ncbi:Beta-amylase 8 [Asimina triloba]
MNSNSSNSNSNSVIKQDLDHQHHSDNSSDPPPPPQQQQQSQRRPRGFAAAAAAAAAGGDPNAAIRVKREREREREKERTKLRERHRRSITSRMLAGLRQYGNFPLPARADMNDVLAALAREAGWTVEADGTTYRSSPPPAHLAPVPIRSIENPQSAAPLKNSSVTSSALRVDESLSPVSIESLSVAGKNPKGDKFANTSPINTSECLDPDQVMQDVHLGEHENNFTGNPYIPVYAILPAGVINNFCQLVDPEGLRQELRHLKSLDVDGVVVDCWWGIVEGWSPRRYQWSGYRDLFNIIREFKLKLQVQHLGEFLFLFDIFIISTTFWYVQEFVVTGHLLESPFGLPYISINKVFAEFVNNLPSYFISANLIVVLDFLFHLVLSHA